MWASRENFWKPLSKDEELAQKVFEAVIARPTFDVVVDYRRSLEQMIVACKLDWVNDSITAEHFPLKAKGTEELNIVLFHFNRPMESKDVIKEMDKAGFKPAKIEELLALGEAHPDLQREFPIVELGSVWRRADGHRRVAYLCRHVSERHLLLSLHRFVNWWDAHYRFAALCK